DKAFVRQAPVFQLHDQSMKLLRLQRYIGRHKFLVAFIDASQGADRSDVVRGLKERFSEFEKTGGLIVGVTAGRRRKTGRPSSGWEVFPLCCCRI
ncbi:MAG: hypothetical protein ACK5F7_07035, partial [Planctomycetaceae bacterium]